MYTIEYGVMMGDPEAPKLANLLEYPYHMI